MLALLFTLAPRGPTHRLFFPFQSCLVLAYIRLLDSIPFRAIPHSKRPLFPLLSSAFLSSVFLSPVACNCAIFRPGSGHGHALHGRDAHGPRRRHAAHGAAIPRRSERGWGALPALVREAQRVITNTNTQHSNAFLGLT